MKKLSLFVALFVPVLFFAQNGDLKKLNPVILKHYTEKELSEIQQKFPKKIEQIIFLYDKSYSIKNPQGKPLMASVKNFDVAQYNNQRKDNNRVTINLNHNGDVLELLSWNEVKAEYNKIMNN